MQPRIHLHQPRVSCIILLCLLSPLTTPNPLPSNTTELQDALPDRPIVADICPTPPTQFLPYAPPPGYTPAPGCAPAYTQPSESNPPAGVYGNSGSGSGNGNGASGSTETIYSSSATGRGGDGRGMWVVVAGAVLGGLAVWGEMSSLWL